MRIATAADIDAATETIALAFADDPVWGTALRGAAFEHHLAFWRFFVEGALPFGTVLLERDAAAVALWIPPGEEEMSEDAVERLRDVVRKALDPAAAEFMFELWDRFDEHHPSAPHQYLSLLATHPSHRGKGIAQELVRTTFSDLDARGIPAYLESTNPANDHRYERLGFRRIDSYEGATPGSVVSQMWRDVP